MGRYDIGTRASFALQATQACMAKIEFPIDLTGAWGRFQRPRTISDTREMSRVMIGQIRLLNRPDTVACTCDVFEDDQRRLTALGVLSHVGVTYAYRFHSWVENNCVTAEVDKRYREYEIATSELRALSITRHPQFEYYAACHPAEATVLRTGLSNGGFAVLDTAVRDFYEFEKVQLQRT